MPSMLLDCFAFGIADKQSNSGNKLQLATLMVLDDWNWYQQVYA
jgi:hypothetical protein